MVISDTIDSEPFAVCWTRRKSLLAIPTGDTLREASPL